MRDHPAAMARTFLIAAGGTAGHVVPALAVADALRADGARVVFAGGQRAEAQLVPAAGYELRRLAVEGLSRTNPLKAARAVGKAAGAVAVARRILRELRPDAVLGGGGYVAGPVGAAAVLGRVPLVLAEADSHLGLTNRLLAPFARRVCLAFPLAGRDGERYLVTGRPVPPPWRDRAAARAAFGLEDGAPCVLVFGGSLGARSINEAAVDGLAGGGFRVVHACGTRDLEALRARLGQPPPTGYDLRAYITPFGEALAAADLVVARAGGSIFEVAAHGKPAILVPYPHASADHQAANARWMADAGAAVVVPDGELSPERLRAEVAGLLGDPERLAAMGGASAALARPDAAAAVAAELRAAAAGPGRSRRRRGGPDQGCPA
jgi:UDP-N-acetylglucosamine--N-acetylmuramyl-(pentapeptide) pyrophosphoryl-undecaprenol N-acetylglucosamine transferase